MTSALLLGASGFIGAHVHDALTRHDTVDQVVPVGRARLDLSTASVEDVRAVVTEVAPDVVINCTGGLDGNMTDLIRWQTVTTSLLLDALSGSGIRLVRLGSAGEYGPIENGTSVAETAPAAPVSAYGISHLAATLLINQAVEAGAVDAATVRVFNPIGSGSGTGSLLARAASEFLSADNGATVTFGPLSPYRDFVDARDVADAVVAVAVADSRQHTVYNAGSGAAVRIRDAVRRMAELSDFRGEIAEAGAGAARSSGIDWTQADISRLQSEFGWTPQRSLDDSLTAIVEGTKSAVAQPVS